MNTLTIRVFPNLKPNIPGHYLISVKDELTLVPRMRTRYDAIPRTMNARMQVLLRIPRGSIAANWF